MLVRAASGFQISSVNELEHIIKVKSGFGHRKCGEEAIVGLATIRTIYPFICVTLWRRAFV